LQILALKLDDTQNAFNGLNTVLEDDLELLKQGPKGGKEYYNALKDLGESLDGIYGV
jgi:hypothetical protein